MDNQKKHIAFVTVDYEDGDASTFKGIIITYGDKTKSFNTGDPLIDWYDYSKFVYGGCAYSENIFSIRGSSSIDHWFMDTDDYFEEYLTSDDDETYRFMTDSEIDLLSFSEMDKAIKCVRKKDMNTFEEVKNYYKLTKKI